MIDLTAEIDDNKIIKGFDNIEKSAKSAISSMIHDFEDVDKAIIEFNHSIKSQKEEIKGLKKAVKEQLEVTTELALKYKEAHDKLSTVSDVKTKETLTKELEKIEKETEESVESLYNFYENLYKAEEGLKNTELALRKYKDEHASLRAKMANVRNEMAQLELAGQQNSARYKELQDELGRLGTAYRRVQQEQKALTTGATQWAGIQSGLHGLMGAYAAGIGVVGMFTTKNEKLIEIQTKLQSVMGVIIGMSQVSNALHETSAFRMTTLTKVTELWNSANSKVSAGLIRLGVSAGTATVAAQALMATLTLGLSVAITAAIAGINKLIKKHQESKKAAEEAAKKQKEAFDNYAKSVASNAADTIAKFNALQQQYNKLGDSLQAKKKFIKDNQKEFHELGVSINNVNEADNLFIKNEEAFRLSIEKRAKAAAAMKLASKKYEDAIVKMIEADNLKYADSNILSKDIIYDKRSRKWSAKGLSEEQNKELTKAAEEARKAAARNGNAYSLFAEENAEKAGHVAAQNYIKGLKKSLESESSNFNEEAAKVIKEALLNEKEADDAFRAGGFTSDDKKKEQEVAAKKQAEIAKKLRKLILAEEIEVEKSRIDLMKDGAEKRIAQIEFETKQTLQKLEERRNAIKELEKQDTTSERYKAGVEMKSAFNGNVDLLARPLIAAAELVKKGWEEAGEGIATVFSSQYGIQDATGKVHEILITPILPNGDVLSPEEFEDYIFNTLEGAQNILEADKKGLVIAVDVSEDGTSGDVLHQLQEKYYQPFIDIEEQIQNILDTKRRSIEEVNKEEEQAWNTYLSKYGSYEERRLAIAKLYEQKIENARTEGERKSIEQERDQILVKSELESWNEYLKKYGTFRERLQATKDSYDRKLAEAKNEGERAMIQAEYDAAIAEFEVQASEWVKELTGKSTNELEKMISEFQKRLADAEKAYDKLEISDTAEAGQYRATINKLKAQIEVLKNKLDEAKKSASDSDWAKSAQLFNDISATAREAANALGEFDEGLGAVATAIATMASSVGNLISALNGLKAGLSALEKASAILAIISAAFQLLQGIFSIFNHEDPVAKTRKEFEKLNDELIKLKRESALDSWKGTIFDADAYNNTINNLDVSRRAFERYNKLLDDIQKRGKEGGFFSEWSRGKALETGKANLYLIQHTWQSVAESIKNMQVQTRHSTWFRSAKYDSLGNLLPELFDNGELNMDALKDFADSDLFSKLTEKNQKLIEDLISEWDLYQDAIESVKDYLSGIFGDLGSTITDSLVDAFANGTDAAEAYCDSVADMVKQLAKDMIYSMLLAPLFEKAQEDMLAAMQNEGNLSPEDQFRRYSEIIRTLMNDVQNKQDDVDRMLQAFKEASEANGLDIFRPDEDSVSAQTATRRGFNTLSQDTGDELLGRMTAIQGDVHDIRAFIESNASQNAEQLNQIVNVRDIMIQINGNVADIRTYTRVLPEMSDTLTSMNAKLDNL